MQDRIKNLIEHCIEEQARRRRIYGVLLILSLFVVTGVFWSLKLNGIALAGDAFCGQEEHTHTEECYERVLICGQVEETEQSAALICGQEEKAAHHHTEACWEIQHVLDCQAEEHVHGADCYVSEDILTCTLEEKAGHAHDETCYDAEGNLICGQEECEGHTHSKELGCYETTEVLVCTVPEHTHEEVCYTETKVCICGQEECEGHTHTDACYGQPETHTHSETCYDAEGSLICTQEETKAHVHTDACYEEKLICEKEEHTHTTMCYSDKSADLESASHWESTLPEQLTEEWAENLLLVAKSQLGYTESSRNYIWDEENERQRGYTRYGAWYGNEYGDWCAMFVSFCLNYAEIPREAVPYEAGCYAWTVGLKEWEIYEQPDTYMPSAGDIIFFDYKNTGRAEHVGIVAEVEEKEDGRQVIHTIEGNSSNRVKENTYDLTDTVIFGYGNLAKAKVRYDELYGTDEPEEAVSSTLNAVIYTDDTYAVEAEDDETIITVTGILPADATVKACPVTVEIENQEVIAAYDIAIFQADCTVYEPAEGEKLEVRFTLPEQEPEVIDSDSEEPGAEATEEVPAPAEYPLSVYYVPEAEEGLPEQIHNTTVENNEIIFEAEHFSVYAVVRAARAAGDVVDETSFKNAFDDESNNGKVIQLNADFKVTDANKITLGAGRNITLDLNGHKLTVEGGTALFTINGGTLTIIDSQKIDETTPVTVTDKDIYGNLATYTEADGLTYYVTESTVTNPATGATTEILKKYVLPLSGRINAGGATVVNLTDGTVNLESGMLYEGTNRAFNVSGGTLNLKGGYIFGFEKNENGAAIYAKGNSLINMSGCVLAANKSTGKNVNIGCGGAIAIVENTTMNITNGAIAGNEADGVGGWEGNNQCGGGGIYCGGNVTLTMSGGYLTNNYAASKRYFDGGGGVFLTGTSEFTLNGGYITGNQAQGGGGIKTDFGKNPKVTMNGGFISSNATTDAEGGGVTIDRGGNGYFNAGYITNNKILNTVHWGGGGLFCADGSSLYLKKALITENDAGGFGGGVAGCPTGKIYLYVDDGCAIYNNDDVVNGEIHFVNGGAKDGIDAERCDVFFQSHGHKDYFCALNSTVTGTMLGGSPANWEGSADGTAVRLGANDAQTATSVMGLEAHPEQDGIDAAQANAAVYINGNYSYTHGGGILCNGNLIVGNPTNIKVPARLGLTATKAFLDASGNEQTGLDDYNFQFEILDSNNQVVSTATCDENGKITFDNLVFEKEGTYVYTIREVKDDSKPSINYDTTEYRLTVTVKEEVTQLYEAKKTAYLITNTKVEKSNGNGEWIIVSDKNYGNGKDNLALSLTGDDDTFINTTESVSKITVIKKWADNIVGADSVTVDLYQDGELYDTVELSAENSWTYTWTDLPLGHSYEVKERELRGYIASYETSNSQGERTDYWVPASSLEVGKQYMIVNGDGSKALYISPDHQNNGFDNTDTREVIRRTGTITVGTNTYSNWYDAKGIDPRCIFTAQERTQNTNKGIILKNNGASVNTWLLIQNTNNNYLKSTSGSNYASFMVFEGGLLKGHDNYNWNPNNLRTLIYSSNKFNTSTDTNNAVRLYTLVSGSASDGSVITITNTPKEEDFEYNLPETGGTGTHGYILWGLFLMAASLGIYGHWTFKKRKERSEG